MSNIARTARSPLANSSMLAELHLHQLKFNILRVVLPLLCILRSTHTQHEIVLFQFKLLCTHPEQIERVC